MVGRYKRQILRLTESLRRLESERDNLDTLLALQNQIVQLITKAEANIARLRETARKTTAELKGGRLPKGETGTLRKRIETYKKRIDDYQYLKFIWKCFGDGIAFIYLDKFALKHTYYDTTDYMPKQDAGALSGKTGLKQEWAILQAFKNRKIPAMLCDITNTLRHGDICILVGPDPMPIEVKSSSHANSRLERQVRSIKALTGFFENDEAPNFRGFPRITRVEFSPPEVTHLDVLNRCIADSEGKPVSIASPEPGLHYFCMREATGLEELPAGTISSDSILCVLNEAKREREWPPYFPFTLSIRSPLHLYQFIRGEFTLAVLVDSAELRRQFSSRGLQIVLPHDGDWAIWMRRPGEEGASAVSRQMFGRLFHEFQSLVWFAAVQSDYDRQIEADLTQRGVLLKAGAETPEIGWPGEMPERIRRLFDEPRPVGETASMGSVVPAKQK